MNKKEVKNILLSLTSTSNNEEKQKIIFLLGKLDGMSDEEVEKITNNFDEVKLKEFLKEKISIHSSRTSYFIKANNLFEYGINGDCVHLHLPGDFHNMFKELGTIKSTAIIAKSLINAVENINTRRNIGDPNLSNCSSIYMISPIFYSPTFYPSTLRSKIIRDHINIETPIFKIFKMLGIETHSYMKEQLQKSDFVNNNPEAQLAIKHFGNEKDVGVASLTFEKFNSKNFQNKLKKLSSFLEKISNSEKEHVL